MCKHFWIHQMEWCPFKIRLTRSARKKNNLIDWIFGESFHHVLCGKNFCNQFILIKMLLPLMCILYIAIAVSNLKMGQSLCLTLTKLPKRSNWWSSSPFAFASVATMRISSEMWKALWVRFLFSFSECSFASILTNSLWSVHTNNFYQSTDKWNRLPQLSKAWKSSCISFQLWHCDLFECGMFGKPVGIFAESMRWWMRMKQMLLRQCFLAVAKAGVWVKRLRRKKNC